MDHENKNEKNGLFIPTRQVTAYVSLVVSVLFMVFISGYFLGKKQIVDQFVVKVEQDSFADQIYASICTLYDQNAESSEMRVQRDNNSFFESELSQKEVSPAIISSLEQLDKEETSLMNNSVMEDSVSGYYAQLIGYGTKKAADAFVQKLQKKDIPVLIKNRKSKTAQGRIITWYQVVTTSFSDRGELELLTQRIARDEKVKGIQICSC
jgi:hypothetical protein